jgi:hypothetical protein
MSSTYINAHMDTSDHRLCRPAKGPGVVTNGLTDIKTLWRSVLSFSIGAVLTGVLSVPHRQKYKGVRSGERGGCSSKTQCSWICTDMNFVLVLLWGTQSSGMSKYFSYTLYSLTKTKLAQKTVVCNPNTNISKLLTRFEIYNMKRDKIYRCSSNM